MKKILIYDATLTQATSLSFKEKLEIVKKLSALGVDVIELPFPTEKADEVLIKTLCTCVCDATLSCSAPLNEKDIEKAFSLIKQAKKNQISLNVPVSPVQMEYFAGKKATAVLDILSACTVKAKSLSSQVEVCLEDITRAEITFLSKAIDLAVKAGATTICLKDCAGNTTPDKLIALVKDAIATCEIPNGVKVVLACNDSLSLAVSVAVSAIENGIDGLKTTAIQVENYPYLEKVILALEAILEKSGYTTNVNKSSIKRTLSQISGFASSSVEISSDNLDAENEKLEQNLSEAQLKELVAKRGYSLSSEDLQKVYEEYQRLASKKTVNGKELDVIIATHALQVKETYSLVSFSVNTSNVLDATASIVLSKNEQTVSGLSYGNGPIDASFLALENIIGRHFELDDFELSSVTEGKEAMGQALVKLRNNGVIYSGRGLSTDVIGASIRAYINAVNKIIYEENN